MCQKWHNRFRRAQCANGTGNEVKSARNPGFGETGPAKYYFVRAAAAAALGEIGAAAKSAVPALKAALKAAHRAPNRLWASKQASQADRST